MPPFMRFASAAICALFLVLPAVAERYAFVLGNSEYANTSELENAVRDTEDISAALQSMGYNVSHGTNLSRVETLERFQDFVRQLNEDDLAMVYYAGHGLQLGGENYIVPVDATLVDEGHARKNLVSVNALLSDLSRSTRNRILILDACRNNPFIERLSAPGLTRGDAPKGLARVFAGVGSYIAFSTQPGNVALDGQGRNSPFAEALLKHIKNDALDVHGVMRRVRSDVQTATNSSQIPWESSSLIDDVSFASTMLEPAPVEDAADVELIEYSYVDGLDPDGDNFLALREGYQNGARRLATMESGTLLQVLETKGLWRRVELTDGSEGWAHSNWISCCQNLPAVKAAIIASNSTRDSVGKCESLWRARNEIWYKYKYCFASQRGKQTFGNDGCSRNQTQALAAMSAKDRTEIDRILADEKANMCR